MPATIKIKNSSTTGAVPTSSDLVQGELAVNVTDLGLYTENASGTVVKLNAPSIDDKNTGATKRLTIDTSGNLGLGVTPSAWVSGDTVLQVKSGSGSGALWGRSNSLRIVGNTFFDGTNYKYIASDYASVMICNPGSVGGFNWNIAASGTAGANATFTQAMTLDASGNLGIGSTSPASYSSLGYRLVVGDGSGNEGITIATGTGDNGSLLFADGTSGSAAYIGYIQYDHSVDAMKFGTGGTERARIDSSGNLLVNKTTTSQSTAGTILYGGGSSNAAYFTGAGGQAVYVNRETSDGTVIDIRRAASTVGTISVTASATAYNTSSDYRLKESIQPMTGALAKVQALKPVTYKWKADGSDGEGFIAHELAEVVPQCVTGEKDAVDAEGNPQYQGIDTSFLVATLTAALQEMKAIIDDQAARIAALEAK
jgi:hypothetical protein